MPPIRPSSSSLLVGFLRAGGWATLKGASITLGSTVASCALALCIEAKGHQLVYYYFPHKYANVEYAYGLTKEQLQAVRNIKQEQPLAASVLDDDISRVGVLRQESILACAMTG